MKGTEQFKEVIKNYLDTVALVNPEFAEKYANTTCTMDDIVAYIISEVQQTGRVGFADEEIFNLAISAIDNPDVKVGTAVDCVVVSNHHIELSEEEKAEQRRLALKRFQDEELRKLQSRNTLKSKPTTKTDNYIQPSLFD